MDKRAIIGDGLFAEVKNQEINDTKGCLHREDRQPVFGLPGVPIESYSLDTLNAPGITNGGHYKPIPTDFTKNGFRFQLIKREKDVAIYRQFKKLDMPVWYEVVIVRTHEEYTIAGKTIPAAEVYPRSESWGTHGFTYTTLDQAEVKFKNLLKGKREAK